MISVIINRVNKLYVSVITTNIFLFHIYINTVFQYFSLVLENDAGPVPLPNDKALKDKKRKLKETLDRMLSLLVSIARNHY